MAKIKDTKVQTSQWPKKKRQKHRQHNGQQKRDKSTRQHNGQNKRDKGTDNTMAKIKETKVQTTHWPK
jgi:hypothetical protein